MPQPTSPKPSPSPEAPNAANPKAVAPSKAKAGPAGAAPRPSRPASHFLRDVSIVFVVCAAGLAYYYKQVQTSKEVNHVAKKAKDLIEKDTPQDFYEAEKHLKDALALDSSNAYCLSALGEINALLWGEDGVADRRGQAEDYTHKADALDPHVAERYSADSLILLYAGQATQAEASVKAVIDRGAKSARLYDAYGRALRVEGKLDDARKAFTDATKAGRIPRFNVDLSEVFFDQGDAINAETYAQKALESNPEHPRALIMRARVGIARGLGIKSATDDLASLLGPRKTELTPSLLAEAYTARAELKIYNKQPADAAKDAKEAVAANGKYAPAHQALGMALVQSKDVGQALNEFDRAQAIDPYVSTFYFDAARALSLAGEGDKAIAILKKVATKDEHYHLAYGDLLERKGDQDNALAEYEEAIKLNSLSAQGFYGKGKILFAQKKIPEAGAAFQAALGAQPTFPEAHEQMGYVLLEGKKYEDAASEFEQSLNDMMQSQAPREQITALRDEFVNRLKKTKGVPKGLIATFNDDLKKIVH
jgi:tetratricopeptide (TPR) repeat protein